MADLIDIDEGTDSESHMTEVVEIRIDSSMVKKFNYLVSNWKYLTLRMFVVLGLGAGYADNIPGTEKLFGGSSASEVVCCEQTAAMIMQCSELGYPPPFLQSKEYKTCCDLIPTISVSCKQWKVQP